MPNSLRVKMNKRMTCFMEYISKKKIKSRVDVYMDHLKQISNKEIYEIEDKHVLEFVIFKDVNDSGRTVVHKDACPYLGTSSIERCEDNIQCGLRHQAESMRVGIVDKPRRALRKLGGRALIAL